MNKHSMKVLITDPLPQEGIEVLQSTQALHVDCMYGLSHQELVAAIKGYDALIVRSTTQVTTEVIESADCLRVIGRAGVGMDNIDINAAREKGIEVLNTPDGNTVATAEFTMGMILNLARNIGQASQSMKSGRWERAQFKGIELKGKTLGVIGFGRIGSTVAGYAKAFGMRVIAHDSVLTQEKAHQSGVERAGLDALLGQSDMVTVHVPLTAATTNLIAEREFGLMKRGMRLINCARGGIVDERALVAALQSGRVAGCALDVFEQEPLDSQSPLLKFSNCIAVPHIGAATDEARVHVAVAIVQSVRDALLSLKTCEAESPVKVVCP